MTVVMTLYTLVWPVVVAGTLALIVSSFVKDWRKAKREGKDLI